MHGRDSGKRNGNERASFVDPLRAAAFSAPGRAQRLQVLRPIAHYSSEISEMVRWDPGNLHVKLNTESKQANRQPEGPSGGVKVAVERDMRGRSGNQRVRTLKPACRIFS